VTPVPTAPGDLPVNLGFFTASPDGKRVAVVESETDAVAVVEIDSGKTQIISPPHPRWQCRTMPAWKSATELTFAALHDGGPAWMLWREGEPLRCISESWPKSSTAKWLEQKNDNTTNPAPDLQTRSCPMKPAIYLLFATSVHAEDTAFFESKIRPVLVEHCYECHSAESGKSKGGLMLDTKAAIRAGGDTGPAVVPGDVAKSLLLTAIKHSDPDLEMPPKEPQLPKAVIADMEAWIKAGAADPRESAVKAAERPPVDVESGRKFWSYQKPQKVIWQH
jgi:hypothetical protein